MYVTRGLIAGTTLAISFILLLTFVPGGELIRFAQVGINADIRADLTSFPIELVQFTGIALVFIYVLIGNLRLFFPGGASDRIQIFVMLFVILLTVFLCFTLFSFVFEKSQIRGLENTLLSIGLAIVLMIVFVMISSLFYGLLWGANFFGMMASFTITIAIWLFLIQPTKATSPPLVVQVARLERTATAQQLNATLNPQSTEVAAQRTETEISLQETANALSIQVGEQSAEELATLEAQSTQNALSIDNSLDQPLSATDNLQSTIVALQRTLEAPTDQNTSPLVDTESLLGDNNFQFVVATILSILGVILAFIQVSQGRRR